jgi:dTDP-glucose pyrophosphorylase
VRTNVLVPSAGVSEFFKDSYYPKTLVEVNGKPMIQYIVEEYQNINNVHYIFLLKEDECRKFHTDNIVKLLTDSNCDIIYIRENTKGALCTSLLAVDYIDNEDELIIVNNDEVRDVDYNDLLHYYKEKKAEAGVISFESCHPRWTYIRTEGDYVVEVAEKKPISKKAVTGFYYYRHGKNFVTSAKRRIRKRNPINGVYYVSGSINEMILQNLKVSYYQIAGEAYHSLYSMEKIKNYEKWVGENENRQD